MSGQSTREGFNLVICTLSDGCDASACMPGHAEHIETASDFCFHSPGTDLLWSTGVQRRVLERGGTCCQTLSGRISQGPSDRVPLRLLCGYGSSSISGTVSERFALVKKITGNGRQTLRIYRVFGGCDGNHRYRSFLSRKSYVP